MQRTHLLSSRPSISSLGHLGTGLEVVQEDVHALAVDSIVLYDDTAASYDLAWVAVLVNLAEAGPSSEEFGVGDLESTISAKEVEGNSGE